MISLLQLRRHWSQLVESLSFRSICFVPFKKVQILILFGSIPLFLLYKVTKIRKIICQSLNFHESLIAILNREMLRDSS